jgi:hypothetical protein
LSEQFSTSNEEIVEMASWFHTAVLATAIVATAAVGFASAAMLSNTNLVPPKGDRLETAVTVTNANRYETVETRSDDGSVLARVIAD